MNVCVRERKPPEMQEQENVITSFHILQKENDNQYVEDTFLQFVSDQVDKIQSYIAIQQSSDITFDELNRLLTNYSHIYLSLVSLYNKVKLEYQMAQNEFDQWFAEKFITIRARENKKEISAQKWASQKELEYMVIVENKIEYKSWKNKLVLLERKTNFLQRLLDVWTSLQYVLNTLSKNLQVEVGMSNIPAYDTEI